MSINKVAFQCQAIPQGYEALLATNPVNVKFLGNGLNEEAVRKVPLECGVTFRRAGGDEDFTRDPVNEGIAWANETFAVLERFLRIRPDAIVETINEPNPTVVINNVYDKPASIELAKKLNAFQVSCANRLHQLGVQKVGAYQFSVGQPPCRRFNGDDTLWPYLLDGIRASNILLLHEYSARRMQDRGTAYCLRYRDVLAELATFGVHPLVGITETGIDRGVIAGKVGGYRDPDNGTTIDDYISDLQWYATEIAKDNAVQFAHVFLAGRSDDKWKTFDVAEEDPEREKFRQFLQWRPAVTPPSNPNPGPPMTIQQERIKAATNSIGRNVDEFGVVYEPSFAFPQFAAGLKLGPPLGQEYRYTRSDNARMAGQAFRDAIVECIDGQFGNSAAYSWDDGELWTRPPSGGGGTPPANTLPPFSVPPALTSIGASATPGSVPPGDTLYRLTGASVRQGVSAFCRVVVIGVNRLPAVGVQVVNLFPDGNGEILVTDGSGAVQFNYGASSAFTPPAPGPFTIFCAEGAVKTEGPPKRVTWTRKISDTVTSLGDPNGEHTECNIQLAGYVV